MSHKNWIVYFALACIGLANALPLPLMGGTLSVWLTEEGFSKQLIGLFSLLAIPFSMKILWTPLIDCVSLPFFKESPRKGWVLLSMWGISLSLFLTSFLTPHDTPSLMACSVLMLSMSTGCLYIAGISYELESLSKEQYSTGSSSVLMGYRLGLLMAGGGMLYLSYFWDWAVAYRVLAGLIVLGSGFIFCLSEPFRSRESIQKKREAFSAHGSMFRGVVQEIFIQPCRTFFRKPEWKIILVMLFLFKFGDQMMKSMQGPFYLSLGFHKTELAKAAKIFGMASTLFGVFLGGLIQRGKDPYRALAISGLIHALSLSCFSLMCFLGPVLSGLYATVAIENITGGAAMAIFIRFLWSVVDARYASVQYALFWSLFSLKGDIAACLGGCFAHFFSWSLFLPIVAFSGMSASLLSLYMLFRKQKRPQTVS